MDPVRALSVRRGAAWLGALRELGVGERDLRAALRRGEVCRLGRGVFAVPDAPDDAVLAARHRGSLTCVTAAMHYGLDALSPPARVHLSVPRNQSGNGEPLHSGVVLHRDGAPSFGPAVRLSVAVATALRCLETREAVTLLDAGLRSRRILKETVLPHLRGPGSVEARRRLSMGDAGSGSPIETLVRLALRQAGLLVQTQVEIVGVGRVDLLVDGWLVVEVDGFEFHAGREQYRNDRRRTNALVRLGYQVLRFSYEDVMHHMSDLIAMVLSVYVAGR